MKSYNVLFVISLVVLLLGSSSLSVFAEIDLSQFTFTSVKNATLHYFGVGDTVRLKSEKDLPGSLVIVGGGLQLDNEAVYTRFIELAGGAENAKIVIMPTANADPVKNGKYAVEDFVKYGVSEDNLMVAPVAVKDDSSTDDVDESTWKTNGMSAEVAASLAGYTGVWFLGGWQDRITAALLNEDGSDGAVLKAIKDIYAKGGVIGGSSAGAAIMSDPMINGGTSLGALTREIIREDMGESDPRLFIAPGIGFFPFGFIDQHTVTRGRFGRLIAACIREDIPMGFGIEENTAIAVSGNEFEVLGVEASRNGVVVVDLKEGIESYQINKTRETTKGQEYFDGNTLNTNIFGKGALVDMIAEELVDNTAAASTGLSFEMLDDVNAIGVKVIFSETENTEGFYGKISGQYTYSAVNVNVSIVSITLTIQEVQQ